MKIYAYVPGQDRSWIRRCNVPTDDLHTLVGVLVFEVGVDWPAGEGCRTVGAAEVLVALDWLDDRSELPPALGGRLRRETKVERWLLYRSGRLPPELLVDFDGPGTWRECFRPYLRAVLKQLEGQPRRVQDQALREAFPAGQRVMYPYQTWLDEIRVQRGEKPAPRPPDGPQTRQEHPDQALLFGGAP